jgi:hypothetical protein
MRRSFHHIDFEFAPRADGRLRFLAADWDDHSPFMWLTYAIDHKRVEQGLRLDVDKKVIIDETGNPELDRFIRDNAEKIWDAVVKKRREASVHQSAN